MKERWKSVVGFEGLYEVSDRGRIRSLKQKPIVIMRQKNNSFYREVKLRKNNRSFMRYIHRLVLEAFRGSCPARMECRHLDGNRYNNNIENLLWGTKVQNQRDSIRHGTKPMGVGHVRAKLTRHDVRLIRSSQDTLRQLADEFKVSDRVIYRVKAGLGYV